MIDPKFNEIPETPETAAKKVTPTGRVGEQTAAHTGASPRQGLSINDTIAADANLSVGGRGADTSGARSGAGAGAGSSFVTPGTLGESPAPRVAPGPTGSGSTPLSDAATEQTPTPLTSPVTSSELGSSAESSNFSSDDVAAHAYRIWVERGSPHGSPEEDWHRAEREIRERAGIPKSSAATA